MFKIHNSFTLNTVKTWQYTQTSLSLFIFLFSIIKYLKEATGQGSCTDYLSTSLIIYLSILVLRVEPRSSSTLGKHHPTEL